MADAFGKFLQGYTTGNALKTQRQEEQRRTQLGELLSGARGATGDQRNALLTQAYGVDPNSAMAAEQQFAELDDMKAEQLGRMASVFVSMPAEQRAQAWPTIRQELAQIIPGQYPDVWDEQYLPVAENLVQQLGGVGGRIQSTFVDAQGNRVAIMRDGSTQIVGRNAPNIKVMEQEGQLPYGVVTSGGAAGSVQPIGGAPQPFAGAGGAAVQIGADLPPQVQDAIRASEASGQAWTGGMGGGVGPVRVPTAAETAYESEIAKGRAGLQLAPAQAQADAQRESMVTEARESASLGVERQKLAPKARMAMEQAEERAKRVTQAIDRALPMVSMGTTGFIGKITDEIPGSPARDLRAQLDTIKANIGFDELNAMRQSSPTGGALGQVTERELAFLQAVMGNLENAQSPEQLREQLAIVKQAVINSWARVREAYEQDFGGQSAAPSGTRLRFNPATGRIE